MTQHTSPTIDYQRPLDRPPTPKLIRVGAVCVVVADVALLVAVFIVHGGRYWGPYLYPLVGIDWVKPIAGASFFFGLAGLFASGVGLVRPAPRAWKAIAAVASIAYLIGVVCVVFLGLL